MSYTAFCQTNFIQLEANSELGSALSKIILSDTQSDTLTLNTFFG